MEDGMTRKAATLACVCLILGSGSEVRAQFKCGHVFVAESSFKLCQNTPQSGPDRIWDLDPKTGEATLFAVLPPGMCGFLTGLAFTPDGTRLRASSWLRSEILEFDPDGNVTTVLGISDGIACPWGFNNLAYDAEGNFYVANQCTRNILRFPVDGGPATVFADAADGIGSLESIAFAADGDLYFTTVLNNFSQLRRVTPDGNATDFDNFGSIILGQTLAGDKSGHIYVALKSAEIFRYDAGNPESKELLAMLACGERCSITMSPDQHLIYFHRGGLLFGIDVVDGTVATLVDFTDPPRLAPTAGMAVVPTTPPCIPAVSQWGLIAMVFAVLAAGTIVIQRRRSDRVAGCVAQPLTC